MVSWKGAFSNVVSPLTDRNSAGSINPLQLCLIMFRLIWKKKKKVKLRRTEIQLKQTEHVVLFSTFGLLQRDEKSVWDSAQAATGTLHAASVHPSPGHAVAHLLAWGRAGARTAPDCHSLQACPRPYLHCSARDLLGTSQRLTEWLRANVLLRCWPKGCSQSRWMAVGTLVPSGIFQRCANRELSPSAGTSHRWQEARRWASSADSCEPGSLPHRWNPCLTCEHR